MLIILLGALTAIEITRLVLSLIDSHRVAVLNRESMKRAELWDAEHQAIRKSELDGVKEMAKELGRLEQILAEFTKDAVRHD